ncbi:L-lactate dehydrogenase [Theileria orientalis strain Shintoku]|uniref:L-lactate dehydrogenase n=1 Tax=Theileria orientalis strain Shintoku TaxID=869250 RepID=J4C7U8_THEOR|nr:L-lactate dehydrogenase [Theileria orientalis strain Shintoku]BAM39663.1 L-lactate dehydrogenase [Theileria orientalis strain Shintoku]|eukprot:XP_009689964.1 L-lactate dehydrogenase [Theileria orientalis strain Shintoku]
MTEAFVKRRLISLIGSGNIGGIMGYLGQLTELADIVLFDIVPNLGAAKSLDIVHANTVAGIGYKCKGTTNYEDIAGSDVCIVTAGLARQPSKSNEEWSRDDLVSTNSKIITTVAENIKKYAPNAFVICITNPMDVMVHLIKKVTGFPKNRVVGMGGLLDSSRMRYYIAEKLNVNPKYVHGSVIGAHGDSMIPLVSKVTVNGVPISYFIERGLLTTEDLEAIEKRTISSGIELLKLYGTGSAYFSPATAAIEMASSYLHDKKSIFACSCYLDGEYGHKEVYCGTLAVIGAGGVERVFELDLTPAEKERYDNCIKEIRRLEALIK